MTQFQPALMPPSYRALPISRLASRGQLRSTGLQWLLRLVGMALMLAAVVRSACLWINAYNRDDIGWASRSLAAVPDRNCMQTSIARAERLNSLARD